MIKYVSAVVVVLTILLLSGCGPVGPEEYINISVSDGTSPTISWDGGPAYKLEVESDIAVVWAIYTPGCDSLFSPVKYGEVPEGAEILTDSLVIGRVDTSAYDEPLIPDKKYYIRIMRYGIDAIGDISFYCKP